jgi:hypothetical protein
MKIHLDNTGAEIDPPNQNFVIETFQDALDRGGRKPEPPIIPGPLTPEFKAILEAPAGLDRREMDYFIQSGLGIGEYFKAAGAAAAASAPPGSTFQKMFSAGSLIKKTPFVKVDEAKREVWGIITEQKPDKDMEVCDFQKSLPFYQAWVDEFKKTTDGQSFGNLREMHQLSAVGRAIAFDPRPKDKQIVMGFKVVDDAAWKKVVERVYTGFSHGGEKIGKDIPDPDYPGCMRYVAKPSEVSLVDNPCLGSAHYTLIRVGGGVEVV